MCLSETILSSNVMKKYVLIIISLISIDISAKVRRDSVMEKSYSVEIIDSLFFEQVDSFLNSRLSNIHPYRYYEIEFLAYVDPEKRKRNGKYISEDNLYGRFDYGYYIPNRNDSVMYIKLAGAETYLDPSATYKLRFKGKDYLVTKDAVGIFIKRKKKIYVKRPAFSILTMRDLMRDFWYLKWENNQIYPIAIEEQY